jgi:mRNA-degrading endonuclease RelE of RelBE toxin-antitoxin system
MLSDDPRPPGAVRLSGLPNVWRLQLGMDGQSWRVVYQIDDQQQLVRLLRIVARTEGTYRRLP